MNELASKYKEATEQVLFQYGNTPDKFGRCQKWKLLAIESDRREGRNSGVMKMFVDDVEMTLHKIEIIRSVVQKLCEVACQKTEKKLHTIETVKPSTQTR